MANSYASGMQTDFPEALARSRVTILRYLSAGHWPARAGSYHCEKTTTDAEGKRTAFELAKIWDPEAREWVIPRDYWRVLEKSGAIRDANWHLCEYDLPPYHDGEGTYSGFARNVEFDREHLAHGLRLLIPEESNDKGKPGRPGLGAPEYRAELERRIKVGDLESGVAEQSRVLRAWYCAQYPDRKAPKAVTIENDIRVRFREAKNPTN